VTNYILVAAIAAALSGIGFMLMQPVLAYPTDPLNPYAPGIRQSTEGTATDFATGLQFDHGILPSDPYKFSPGFLNRGTCTPGQDIC
jgi:hypothetical protein